MSQIGILLYGETLSKIKNQIILASYNHSICMVMQLVKAIIPVNHFELVRHTAYMYLVYMIFSLIHHFRYTVLLSVYMLQVKFNLD